MDAQSLSQFVKELDSITHGAFNPQNPSLLDLHFAYRLLLQRNPEGDTLEWYRRMLGGHTMRSLVAAILGSPEHQALWQSVPIQGEDVEVSALLPSGLQFHFYLQDRGVGVPVAQGVYEVSLQAAVRGLVKPGMACIDAGANYGLFSLLMAQAAVPGFGRVYSFEPFPKMFHLLGRNIEANGFQGTIIPFQKALHSQPGKSRIYFSQGAQTNYGTMFIPSRPDLPVINGYESLEIEMVRADDVIPADEEISAVKIDVEGSEVHVLNGMQRILREHKPIVFIEFNPWCLSSMGAVEPETLLQTLAQYGYRTINVEDYVSGHKEPFHYAPSPDPRVYNLVCLPKDQRRVFRPLRCPPPAGSGGPASCAGPEMHPHGTISTLDPMAPESFSGPPDVQQIMTRVRRRVRAQNQREQEALRNARKALPGDLIARVSRLNTRLGAMRVNAARIGEMPPSPPTLRGKAGAFGVRLVRHALFWLIPSLQAAQEQVAGALDDQVKALEELIKAIEKTNARLELLLAEQASAKNGSLHARSA